jgi:hypothetical protein
MNKTNEEILIELAMQTLQVCKIDAKIKELTSIREAISTRRYENFKVYEDRLKQQGKEIDLQYQIDLDGFDTEPQK